MHAPGDRQGVGGRAVEIGHRQFHPAKPGRGAPKSCPSSSINRPDLIWLVRSLRQIIASSASEKSYTVSEHTPYSAMRHAAGRLWVC